jgi:ArsR family transcriptional regulator
MTMQPEQLFSLLSDPTRLRALMLIQAEGELCVCELTFALEESQPKVSRHLALMREAGVVEARREGTWMFYRMSPGLPGWAARLIAAAHEQIAGLGVCRQDLRRLGTMSDRPDARACA